MKGADSNKLFPVVKQMRHESTQVDIHSTFIDSDDDDDASEHKVRPPSTKTMPTLSDYNNLTHLLLRYSSKYFFFFLKCFAIKVFL